MRSFSPFGRYQALFVYVVAAQLATNAHAHTLGLSQLGGWVYIDRNDDGILAFGTDLHPEYAISGIEIQLYAKSGIVETLTLTATTDAFGRYLFEDIAPGTYVLRETQSPMFVDGKDTLGELQSLNGQPVSGLSAIGSAANNAFSDIVLTADVGGEFYNFGERGLAVGYTSKTLLFASYSGPPIVPPPPNTPPGEPLLPEPSLLGYLWAALCSSTLWAASRRRRR